jgi:hypothetical protein
VTNTSARDLHAGPVPPSLGTATTSGHRQADLRFCRRDPAKCVRFATCECDDGPFHLRLSSLTDIKSLI